MCLVQKQSLNGTDFYKTPRTAGRPSFRPPVSVADGWKNQHHELMLSGRWKRMPEIAENVRVSVGMCFIILTEIFRMRRCFSAQSIPLTLRLNKRWTNRLHICANLLKPAEVDTNFMQWSIRNDGTWVYGNTIPKRSISLHSKSRKHPEDRKKLGGSDQIWRLLVVSFIYRGFMYYLFFEEVRDWIKSAWPNVTFYILRATNQQINSTVQQVGIDSL